VGVVQGPEVAPGLTDADTPVVPPAAPFRRANVLAVDDKPANLLALEAVLGSAYNLLRANSGREAIELVRTRADIDVILMDVQMPIMDGFEAAARIKDLPEGRDIPIVFVTAVFSEDPYVKRGYEAGGVDYFSKPFDPEILKKKVAIYSSFRLKADLLRERERRIDELSEVLRMGRDLSSQLEHQHVGVLVADSEARVTQMTDEAAAILKASSAVPRDAYGELLEWWLGDGEVLKAPGGPLDVALRGQAVHNSPMELRCVDGERKRLLCSASPLRGGQGEVIGAVLLVHDVSDARKIESDLEEKVAALVAATH